jgi:hypothetical protein
VGICGICDQTPMRSFPTLRMTSPPPRSPTAGAISLDGEGSAIKRTQIACLNCRKRKSRCLLYVCLILCAHVGNGGADATQTCCAAVRADVANLKGLRGYLHTIKRASGLY